MCGAQHPDLPVTCNLREGADSHEEHIGFFEGLVEWPNADYKPRVRQSVGTSASKTEKMKEIISRAGEGEGREVPPPGDVVGDGSIELAFLEFHVNNPEIYESLVALARQAVAAGHDRVSMKMLWEAMRWDHFIRLRKADDSGYRLNNNFTSRYARLIMESEPGLSDLFEIRKLRA